MKKLLGAVLALAMFSPAPASAELFKNLKFSGQIDVQSTAARNVRDFVTRAPAGNSPSNNDRIGNTHTRAMMTAGWDLLDDVHAKVTVVKGGEQTGGSARLHGTSPEDLNEVQSNAVVQEANIKIDKLMGLFDTTVGRQFYGEAGDLIAYYGPRDNYGLATNALDAFRLDWKGEHMTLTGVAGRTSEGGTLSGSGAAATDLRGLVASCNMHETVKPTVYLYNRVTHATGALGQTSGNVSGGGTSGKNDNLWVAGLKAKITAGPAWLHAEGAKNFGEDRTNFLTDTTGPRYTNYKGYALLVKGGATVEVPVVGMINPWGEFGMGTGDSNFQFAGNNNFQSIATDYRPGAIYGRFDSAAPIALGNAASATAGASNGLSNRIIWGAGVNHTPAAIEKLTAGVQYYRYAFHRQAPQSTGLKRSRNIGSEVDVTLNWKHSENVNAKVTLGSFMPGAWVRDVKGPGAALNPAQMAALDLSVKFN